MDVDPYATRLAKEKSFYEHVVQVHDLPDIFHYWSAKYLQPRLIPLGFDTPDQLFNKFAAERCAAAPGDIRFASIGSGNCDLEVGIASYLRKNGFERFTIDCIDVNTAMLERGASAATAAGVGAHLQFLEQDFNVWEPGHSYEAVFANQSIHHVMELEKLFDRVRDCLTPRGSFVISDMIGRNGHQRWPEALEIVHEFWRRLPPSYRVNRSLSRYEELYENWDCSIDGFEGIRSQDILPLLVERFHFRLFLGFINIVDPFIDRAFGHNFKVNAAWDRQFIDDLHQRDEMEMASGHLTPTHMLAVLGKDESAPCIAHSPRSPELSIRKPGMDDSAISKDEESPYQWGTFPQAITNELEFVCRRLARLEPQLSKGGPAARRLDGVVRERTEWALKLNSELQERTAWAQRLNEDLRQHAAKSERVVRERDERTVWAQNLDRELGECRDRVTALQRELEERTAWAQRLDAELHGRK